MTVSHVEEIELNGDKKVVMVFDEFLEKNWFPNLTSIRNLVDALGGDEKKWIGKRAVLEVVKTNDPVKKRQVEALWCASIETWADHLAQADRAANRATTQPDAASAKKTTEKTGSRRR
ncbi:MAG: hypothetical protein ACR2H1_11400 [Limisphaerales bacterium]